ncbi:MULTISPECIES: hypothetical protein [unclassified Streptomyces]|uniref:Uncharacterized protein n=1 Tax=Streptomyces millisiae TaxID=3075542 RepID=A0ABU2LJB2_9ACTN|nr:hypothetical protein [Streptomyces sp. DSM 44918]MDT0317677.1 hypothetical protein [Streptomyces sp. DSM 44918]
MPEREADLVRKVALAAAAVAAASAVTVGTAGAASAAEPTTAEVAEAATVAQQDSALGAVLGRVATEDDTAGTLGTFNR